MTTSLKPLKPCLTRYELSVLLGMRSLQLSDGSDPHVVVKDSSLRADFLYVAGLELEAHLMDAKVKRNDVEIDVRNMRLPDDLYVLLDTRDGKRRWSSQM